jgi:uncharacterized membrane protein
MASQKARPRPGKAARGRAAQGRSAAAGRAGGLVRGGSEPVRANGARHGPATAARRAGAGGGSTALAVPERSGLAAALRPAPAGYAPPALWFQLSTLVLSLAGLGVSIYLTIEHFTGSTTLACSETSTINCLKVTTSPESMVFGIFPVAVLGLAFYVFLVAVNSPWAWRSRVPAVYWARLAGIVAGIGFVLYLIYTEVITLGAICLWCTSVHVITFLLFVMLVTLAAVRPPAAAGKATARR